jgi:hypothetical protein
MRFSERSNDGKLSEILIVVLMKIQVFYDIKPCCLVRNNCSAKDMVSYCRRLYIRRVKITQCLTN